MLYLNYIKQHTTKILCFSTLVKQNANSKMYLLNHLTHKTINAFCFIECKHSALSAMNYLSQVKHCKPRTMLYLKYIKHNKNSILCFTTHIKQNKNTKMYLLNHLTHKTINAFCFIECKHSALSIIC